ncbi:non-ribosomal peptide synthetase [Photorhabdus africana]|uniref:non-ribosomal peptide synthetase n=1 Tax=Photorhabdus africana TaxID=3097554 RepID=UPI002B40921E|nr:amino acid adenylation domain-containing protein [Photorhabdus sp. CRI-LC]
MGNQKSGRKLHDLAPSQIPEWYTYQLNPESAVYNISFNHFFLQRIQPTVFMQTWQILLDRHDIFRIRMVYADGKPKQFLGERIVLQPETFFIDRTELALVSVAEEQEKLARYFARQPFDIDHEHLFRLHLISYPAEEYQLIFTVHHIIWDETSTMNLIREFTALYTAKAEGIDVHLPTLETTFLDYADQINKDLTSGQLKNDQAYWMSQFHQPPNPLELPTDWPRSALQTYNGDTVKIWLPRDMVREIKGFYIQQNSTLFILLLAVLELYFYRISGQQDFVLGCPIAGRKNKDKLLLGCFAVPMPIRCRILVGMSFMDLLKQVTEIVLGAIEHCHYPCVSIIEQLSYQKDLSRPKLFSVMAGVQNNKSEFITIPLGVGSLYTKDVYTAENHGARFDLAIGMDPVGSDIKFFCTYNSDLYDKESANRILDDVMTLFTQVITDPTRSLENYSLLSPSAALRVLVDFNNIDVLGADEKATIVDWFDEQWQNHPERIALIDTVDELSYGKLASQVMQLATTLLAVGIVEQDRVGVLLEPRVSLVVSLLAIMRVGAIYVPLHEDWPSNRLEDVAEQVNFRAFITCRRLASLALPLSPHTLIVEDLEAVMLSKINRIPSRASPDGIAYLLFTSGTTGKPKGIPILHSSLINLIASTQDRYRLEETDRMLFWTASSFDASLLDLCWPLACGAQIVLWPYPEAKLPTTAIEVIDRHYVTVFQTVPLMLDGLSEARLRRPAIDSRLRLIICGAAALNRSVCDRAISSFGCRLVNHYGPTEVTIDALCFDCSEPVHGNMVPIGHPLPNVQVFVLDWYDQPLPIGVTGQICIASPRLSPGYWQAPHLTEAAFFEKTFFPGGKSLRLYRTGDLGKFDKTGVLHYIGRKDNQVKVRGNRVELGDIESTLLLHPAVAKAVVQWQEQENGGGRLNAFVELRDSVVNCFKVSDQIYYQSTVAQRPWLRKYMNLIHYETWPRYFEGSSVLKRYWEQLYVQFPSYQFCLLDVEDNVACVANGIPMYWDGEIASLPRGWDNGIELAFRQHTEGIEPNTILGLAGIVDSRYQGLGLSNKIVEGFRALTRMHGLDQFLGPVRPVGMLDHSNMDVTSWVEARDGNGEPLDFWLRTHERLGAKTLGVAIHSQLIEGTLDEWREWIGVTLDTQGPQLLPETLQEVIVDLDSNHAHYYDPSIWVGHYGLRDAPNCAIDHYGLSELRDHLSERLPAYMLPDELFIISVIPINENGKIDTECLLSINFFDTKYVIQAQNAVQQQLIEIWQDILQQSDIGLDCDFFLLGGQSLKVIEMLNRVEHVFGCKIRVKDFYHQSTIYYLEGLITASLKAR